MRRAIPIHSSTTLTEVYIRQIGQTISWNNSPVAKGYKLEEHFPNFWTKVVRVSRRIVSDCREKRFPICCGKLYLPVDGLGT